MALTTTTMPVSRQGYFVYYGTGSESLDEELSLDKGFELDEIRYHLSIPSLDIVDFTIKLSSILGSAYNVTFVSQAMYGIRDVVWKPETQFKFMNNDSLNFFQYMPTGTNTWGLEVRGWAITG